jgi:glycerol-3-phosphate acyltransferase PlsY
MIIFYQFLFLLITYLVASIPFGLVFGKIFAKVDIRESGSKNIGATNATRILGKKLGFLTLLLDSFKGMVMVIIGRVCFFQKVCVL